MKLVLFDNFDGSRCGEFVGVFFSEKLAKEAIIARAKNEYRTDDKFWLEPKTLSNNEKEYELWRNCKYKNSKNNDSVFYKKENTGDYYEISDLQMNRYY